MKPLDKILVPHDFSDHADRALEVAADLARRYEASVSLLHVHEPRLCAAPEAYLLYQSDELASVREILQKKLAALAQKLTAAGVMHADTWMRAGPEPSQAIVSLATDSGYDLIVMATHGRRGISHALMGSVAEQVVRTATCPVLTVREPPNSGAN
jgi:nucleotide-binding universal stress UspA family protein